MNIDIINNIKRNLSIGCIPQLGYKEFTSRKVTKCIICDKTDTILHIVIDISGIAGNSVPIICSEECFTMLCLMIK